MVMSPNRRIFLNIVTTYGRSLYALVCGLFISRWVLAALGKTDFGLYGVVGGMGVIADRLWTVWRGWWYGGDCVVGLCNMERDAKLCNMLGGKYGIIHG